MRRFRITLIVVCLVLLYLGGSDLWLWSKNPKPAPITIAEMEADGPSREWQTVTGGYMDLDRAISTSGSIELEALLVPLTARPDQELIHILVETRDPHLLELFKQYHFFTDTIPEKKAFRERYGQEFNAQREITGMLVSGLIVRGNQNKLLKLAKQTDMAVADNVVFLSQGKEPGTWRGLFFFLVGLLGLLRTFLYKRTGQPEEPTD